MRATEVIDYLNKDKYPSKIDKEHLYTHHYFSEEDKKVRKAYKDRKKEKNQK